MRTSRKLLLLLVTLKRFGQERENRGNLMHKIFRVHASFGEGSHLKGSDVDNLP